MIYAVTELLQRAAIESLDAPSYSTMDRQPKEVSLACLARHYLPITFLRYIFYVFTFLSFVSVLVSYGLAGPQAVWQLASTGPTTHPPHIVFAIYWAIGTSAVVFFVDALLGVFGSFTVLKGVLFVCVVIIVSALPAGARPTSITMLFSDFSGLSHAATPLLVSCVALGGLSNTMPVTFKLLPASPSRVQVARYRSSILLAAFLCYLLNVGWVLAVLQVVPRVAEKGEPSLTNAYNLGQISTVPLIDALHGGDSVKGAVLKSIEIIVELFIFVSTGVSFFVTAAGMKSFVDGGVANFGQRWRNENMWKWVPKAVAYIFAFGSVLAIVLLNPNGFIAVLTRFSSLALNLQAGALLFVMLYYSRRGKFANVADDATQAEMGEAGTRKDDEELVPLAMGDLQAWSIMSLCVPFFIAACVLAALGPFLGIKMSAGE